MGGFVPGMNLPFVPNVTKLTEYYTVAAAVQTIPKETSISPESSINARTENPHDACPQNVTCYRVHFRQTLVLYCHSIGTERERTEYSCELSVGGVCNFLCRRRSCRESLSVPFFYSILFRRGPLPPVRPPFQRRCLPGRQ